MSQYTFNEDGNCLNPTSIYRVDYKDCFLHLKLYSFENQHSFSYSVQFPNSYSGCGSCKRFLSQNPFDTESLAHDAGLEYLKKEVLRRVQGSDNTDRAVGKIFLKEINAAILNRKQISLFSV